MLNISGVNQYYGQSHILWDLDMAIEPASCTCIMGRNGVGKTTLLKCIMGLLPVQSGSIGLGDTELTRLAAEQRAKLGVGYVPQGREIFSQLTVEENLRIGLGARSDGLKEVPEFIFELFPVLKEMLQRRGGDLSGGQQQQLAIGRALAIDPGILILDEPNEGIQPNIVRQIGDVITHLVDDKKMTVVIVEQKLAFARRVGRYFHLMEKGRVVAKGTIDELSDELVSQHLSV
ncbi:MAG: urea ABC transporter ATP-binding subunit UrtE [Pseudomonadales bacterium]